MLLGDDTRCTARSIYKGEQASISQRRSVHYAPADRQKYIDAFFSNVDWEAVQGRFKKEIIAPAA